MTRLTTAYWDEVASTLGGTIVQCLSLTGRARKEQSCSAGCSTYMPGHRPPARIHPTCMRDGYVSLRSGSILAEGDAGNTPGGNRRALVQSGVTMPSHNEYESM